MSKVILPSKGLILFISFHLQRNEAVFWLPWVTSCSRDELLLVIRTGGDWELSHYALGYTTTEEEKMPVLT